MSTLIPLKCCKCGAYRKVVLILDDTQYCGKCYSELKNKKQNIVYDLNS